MLGLSRDGSSDIGTSTSEDISLLLDDQRGVALGELVRYKVRVHKSKLKDNTINELYIALKNIESPLLRPVYLTGPYSLYVDIRPHNYCGLREFNGDDLQFIADMKPDETFDGILRLNDDARVGDGDVYAWTIDVLSQMTVMTGHAVRYRMVVSYSSLGIRVGMKQDRKVLEAVDCFEVEILNTEQIWNAAPKFPSRPIHLVFLTHGVFSNVGCDMLYINDRLREEFENVQESDNPNLVIRGYFDNAGKTHKGVEYLGSRLAEYFISTIDELRQDYKVSKVSFIGHSLGGVVQAAALHFTYLKRPELFDVSKSGVEPINFIAIASPFLGVIGDVPMYASFALDLGALGKTGRDLNLKNDLVLFRFKHKKNEERRSILEVIATGPAQSLFRSLAHRTLYANATHDGIVPLRTAALLYLDWYGLQAVNCIKEKETEKEKEKEKEGESDMSVEKDPLSADTVEIPIEKEGKTQGSRWLLPRNVHRKSKHKWYKRSQTIRPGSASIWDDDIDFHPPTKASALMSAANILVAPLPKQEYLKSPSTRTDTIFHDKVYYPEELPAPHYKDRELVKKLIYPNDRVHRIQENIARGWQETMSWRKVLVSLQPETHNNIIVRRRFVNAFGWVVIEHLVKEHFSISAS
ncbi:HFL231Cp [Eremothecium sinecaudum]|uniref:HFL231Cp n=1 Tax=Eremothecium sinecaudum TaxID=45286 RepID=A0A0X8HUC9_9SACH|nr:HFL231Cp [Eremothecium sinecaudum]AMD21625.1 HFL231Cp [Eremothecium sinecaudum]